MGTPSVSVIIPAYNRRVFLRQALDSVHNQTYTDFETIVVDDGSTDDLAAAVAAHPARPRVVRQAHQGPAQARNRGLREAAAELVAFLDSDDLWQPRKLEIFVGAMEAEPDANLFYGPMRPVDAKCQPVPGRTKPCHGGWITERLFCSSFVHVPTVVSRKAVLLEAGGFDCTLPVCEDYDLWLRMSVEQPFGLIDEPLALRRLHPNRLSKEQMSRNLATKARVLKGFYEAHSVNGHLDPAVARRRLARVFFLAARAALREGRYRQAQHLCQESRRYGSSPLRTLPIAVTAGTMALFAEDGAALQSSTGA